MNKKSIASAQDQIELMEILGPLFRTIVSDDFDKSLQKIDEYLDLDLVEIPSGTECWTWIIPKKWTLNKATISHKGETVLSSEEHAMAVAPYSQPFKGSLERKELLSHLRWRENVPDAFVYEYRLGINYLMEGWIFTMPFNRVQELPEGEYDVEIESKFENGAMKIGEAFLQGSSKETIVLMSHLCHPGQVNDGVAGVTSAMRVFQELAARRDRKYSYLFLAPPETIGTVAYLWARPERKKAIKYGLVFEMTGVDNPICLKESHFGDAKIDRIAKYIYKKLLGKGNYREGGFRQFYGNDEMVFANPDFDVPMIGIQHFDFPEYHTSKDDMSTVKSSRLDEAHEVSMGIIDVLEKDYVPKKTFTGPVYLSRYDLYVDGAEDREMHINIWNVTQSLGNGESVFEMADRIGMDFERLYQYLERWIEAGLIEKE